jgi:hypothetical protein
MYDAGGAVQTGVRRRVAAASFRRPMVAGEEPDQAAQRRFFPILATRQSAGPLNGPIGPASARLRSRPLQHRRLPRPARAGDDRDMAWTPAEFRVA